MLLSEVRAIYRKELKELYSTEEIEHIFYWIVDHFLELPRFVLAVEPQKVIDKEEETKVFQALSQLKTELPVQYVCGKAYFMDLTLEVSEAVLIPRPETEELVSWVLDYLGEAHIAEPEILDIGTGSGAIALALKKNLPGARVVGLDLSKAALKVARQNARILNLEVDFIEADIFNWEPEHSFDVLISNPPYVTYEEQSRMKANVLKYEPHLALFVNDEDPLVYYERLARLSHRSLKSGGALFVEINERFGAEVKQLFASTGFVGIEVKKDNFGKERMILARLP